MKELYSFKVNRKAKVQKSEEIDGKTIIETVEEDVPTTIVIKQPSRRERNEVQQYNQTVYSKFLRQGVFTRAMIKRTYNENGGVFTKEQEKERAELNKRHEELRSIIQLAEISADEAETPEQKESFKKDAQDAFKEFISVHRSLEQFVLEEEDIYALSAENLSRDKTIEWLLCNLTFIKEGDSFVSPFKGETVEEKNENYELLVEGDEGEFYAELFEKASTVVSLWYLGRAVTKEDFDAAFGILYSDE